MTSIGIIGSEGRMGVALAAAISEAGQRSCGVDKGGTWAPVRERMEALGRAVVVIGEARALVHEAFAGSTIPLIDATTIDDAVTRCREAVRSGDAVLLAPACASFDMFRDYAERGRVFKQEVLRLQEEWNVTREQ